MNDGNAAACAKQPTGGDDVDKSQGDGVASLSQPI